ncbi:MAG: hypothetical protein GQ468_05340 [Candidatus Scalindua sp.]|nr:hypothetical protein [Candidatus Scalindua sp.]
MAYQTGSLTDLNSLRTTIHSFLTSNGWTLSTNVIHKGNVFARIEYSTSTQNHLKLYGGTGKDGGDLLIDEQITATLPDRKFNITLGTFTYHFFLESTPKDGFICMLSYGVRIAWLMFGESVKMAPYTGLGTYFGASWNKNIGTNTNTARYFSYGAGVTDGGTSGELVTNLCALPFMATNGAIPNCMIQCEEHASTWLGNGNEFGPGSNDDEETVVSQLLTMYLNFSGHNQFNSQATLIPYYLTTFYGLNDIGVLGYIDQIRSVRMTDFNTADIFTLGSDQWMVFPGYRKGTAYPNGRGFPVGISDSGLHGIAIKYNP